MTIKEIIKKNKLQTEVDEIKRFSAVDVEESIPEIIPKKLDIMSEPIDILGLSNRTCNILKRNGCWTIGSTAKLTRTELSSFKGMGKNSIEEINTKMRNLFLTTKK